LEILQPDRLRKAALIGLLGIGFEHRLVLSHDSVWCWRGRPLPFLADVLPNWNPTHIFKNVIPALHEAGVSKQKIDAMLIDNPRRFFEG
jgi:phosphotriesterase-related protein